MNFIGFFHSYLVYGRRIRVLSDLIEASVCTGDKILDIGCGDGLIDHLIMQKKPDVNIRGIDILVRETPMIPVTVFDGVHIPFENDFFDNSILIDVLHHTENPQALLKEAARVTKKNILIKDHIKSGVWSEMILKMMDYAGNAHHGVNLPYNYLTWDQWLELFRETGVKKSRIINRMKLYSFPMTLIFDSNLHFFISLDIN